MSAGPQDPSSRLQGTPMHNGSVSIAGQQSTWAPLVYMNKSHLHQGGYLELKFTNVYDADRILFVKNLKYVFFAIRGTPPVRQISYSPASISSAISEHATDFTSLAIT